MLISLLAVAAVQTTPPMSQEQMLSSVALCVATLEVHEAVGTAEARTAWRNALAQTPGADAASREAAVSSQRATLERTAFEAGADVVEIAQAIVILAPNCATVEGAAGAVQSFAGMTAEATS